MLIQSFFEGALTFPLCTVSDKAYTDFSKTWPGPNGYTMVSKVEFPNQKLNFSGCPPEAVVQR